MHNSELYDFLIIWEPVDYVVFKILNFAKSWYIKLDTIEIKERIKALLNEISKSIYVKEQILTMLLLSAVAGESIFLLGPPRTAKSLVSRRLKLAFENARCFELFQDWL